MYVTLKRRKHGTQVNRGSFGYLECTLAFENAGFTPFAISRFDREGKGREGHNMIIIIVGFCLCVSKVCILTSVLTIVCFVIFVERGSRMRSQLHISYQRHYQYLQKNRLIG
ncbi:hypothetical protein AA313_de0206687 [Arthrobotrys entomopaga]|nr:hypothetical protein AA313_de0206687 [Arthrobotrys entomopaga]